MKVRSILALAVAWMLLVCIGSAMAANPADIYPDNKVDWLDVKVLSEDWLSDANTPADIDGSGNVNAVDFTILANSWGWPPPPPNDMVFVDINDPGVDGHEGFDGQMSRYETTNAQYCEFLNAAIASGDIIVNNYRVRGANGSNSGSDFVGEIYLDTSMMDRDSQIEYIPCCSPHFSVLKRESHDMSNHPVVEVSWYGATAFCNYYGYRLPTEWEWQAVADYDGTYAYGCGTYITHNRANTNYVNPIALLSAPYTSPVDYYSSYGYGMNDMAGNVWEWTSSCYYAGCDDDLRVTGGGSWYYHSAWSAVINRMPYAPLTLNHNIGFRACR